LEGVPTKEINKGLIEEALDMVKPAPYLIEPIETPILMEREYRVGTFSIDPFKRVHLIQEAVIRVIMTIPC
jgi:hypothetical protein